MRAVALPNTAMPVRLNGMQIQNASRLVPATRQPATTSLGTRHRTHNQSTQPVRTVRTRSTVICMANSRRMARVSKQIEREIGSLLVSDKVVQSAICPERRRGIDDALSAMASVVEVEVTNDLQVAKVYVSVYSDEAGKATAIKGLQRLEGYVRKHIGRQIRLRLTPEIRFILDESIERSERVFDLLKRIEQIDRGEVAPPPVAIGDGYGGYGVVWEEDEDGEEVLGSVDLGFYREDGDEGDDGDEGEGAVIRGRQSASARGATDERGEETVDEAHVDEMLEFFRQDSRGSKAGGGGRKGGRGGQSRGTRRKA